jgi:hypothetical protein
LSITFPFIWLYQSTRETELNADTIDTLYREHITNTHSPSFQKRNSLRIVLFLPWFSAIPLFNDCLLHKIKCCCGPLFVRSNSYFKNTSRMLSVAVFTFSQLQRIVELWGPCWGREFSLRSHGAAYAHRLCYCPPFLSQACWVPLQLIPLQTFTIAFASLLFLQSYYLKVASGLREIGINGSVVKKEKDYLRYRKRKRDTKHVMVYLFWNYYILITIILINYNCIVIFIASHCQSSSDVSQFQFVLYLK